MIGRFISGWPVFPVLMVLIVSGCGYAPSSRHRERIMGTQNEVIVVGGTPAFREKVLEGAFEILRELDRKLSLYREDSEIVRLNQNAAAAPQAVSEATYDIIRRSLEFYRQTNGAFDITLLPLMKLWGFYEGEHVIPAEAAVRETLAQTGSDALVLHPESREIYYEKPGVRIDLGAIGKGFACDRVVAYLKAQGVESALVNVGGTMFAYGQAPEGKSWRVGLSHPRDPSRTLKVITLENRAVATSGDYEQFFVHEGRRYSHILDPRTGRPSNASVAVSVMAPDATTADALATAFFVLGPEESHRVAKQYPDVDWLLTYFERGDHLKTVLSENLR